MLVEKSLSQKVFKKLYLVVAIWIILAVIFIGVFPSIRATNSFREIEYRSRIDSIKFQSGHRGHPHVKLSGRWRLLEMEEMKIVNYIKVKDSLVKEKGTFAIKVFRNEAGVTLVKEFD